MQIFAALVSDRLPPKTVKSCAKTYDEAAVDAAVAGDDAVARDLLLGHAEVEAAVLDELVELLEAALVEQQLDALARGELALAVLALAPLRAAAGFRRAPGALAQVVEREVGRFRGLDSRSACRRPRRRRARRRSRRRARSQPAKAGAERRAAHRERPRAASRPKRSRSRGSSPASPKRRTSFSKRAPQPPQAYS